MITKIGKKYNSRISFANQTDLQFIVYCRKNNLETVKTLLSNDLHSSVVEYGFISAVMESSLDVSRYLISLNIIDNKVLEDAKIIVGNDNLEKFGLVEKIKNKRKIPDEINEIDNLIEELKRKKNEILQKMSLKEILELTTDDSNNELFKKLMVENQYNAEQYKEFFESAIKSNATLNVYTLVDQKYITTTDIKEGTKLAVEHSHLDLAVLLIGTLKKMIN